jgi:uncharacterized protein YyaL (SSP411 family)
MSVRSNQSLSVRLNATARIVDDRLRERNVKETYWAFRRSASQMARLLRPSNRAFTRVVVTDMAAFLSGVRPIEGETERRTKAAVDWLLFAQSKSGCGGVSLGFFPCDDGAAWFAPYPETTGYIITSLLRYASRHRDERVRRRALEMADWEIQVQMASGAVQGGQYIAGAEQSPCAFNTGMVLDGWCSAFADSKETRFAQAARRAADYLVNDLTDDGYFRTNGQFVKPDLIKTYNCLCAWGLYRLGDLLDEKAYRFHAVRVVEAAIRRQRPNGWFDNNCLTRPEAPLLHTIAYTLQGILEVGLLSRREDFIEAVRNGVAPLLDRMAPNGFLPGRYYSDWTPASFSCCLTGSAQLAAVCYRLFEHTQIEAYRATGRRLVNFLKPLQRLNADCADVNGALAGSCPIFGEYMTGGYPNWATKYLLDALMLQAECELAS